MKSGLASVLHLFILVFTMLVAPSLVIAADGKTNVIAAEVYIDDFQLPTPISIDSAIDNGFATALDSIDISGFAPGSHTIFLHFQDNLLQWSQPIGQSFYVYPAGKTVGQGSNNTLQQAEIFIDTDPGEGNGILITVPSDGAFDETVESIIQSDAVQNLEQGTHSVYQRFQDANGNWSLPIGQSFYIAEKGGSSGGISAGGAFGLKAAEAFFDTDPGVGAGLALLNTANGEVGLSAEELRGLIDIAQLSPGIHTLYVRYQNKSSYWSQTIAQSLYISAEQSFSSANVQATITQAEFAIDNSVFQAVPAADGAFGGVVELVDFTVPVTATDYHAIKVSFSDSFGRTSSSIFSANATPNDQDWDGLPDAWEITYLGGTGYSANDDPDSDGLSNAQEFENGTDPLVKDVSGIHTISGFVVDAFGDGLPGVNICIEINILTIDCSVVTDINGHYILGESVTLAPFIYRVYPVTSAPLLDYGFNPGSRSVALSGNSVSQINFIAEPLVINLLSLNDAVTYQSTQQVSFSWSGNGGLERKVVLAMKRDSVPPTQLAPITNDPNWYYFAVNTENDGSEVVTLPTGLAPANDWRFYVAYADTSVAAASSANFTYKELVIDFPNAEIISVEPSEPIEGELLTLTGQSGLDGHTIVNHYWAVVPLQNGSPVGNEVEIGSDAILTTKDLAAGDWRFVYQVQDDQGLASKKVILDLTLLSAEGLADLAIDRASVRFVDLDGNPVIQVDPGESINIEVDVHNTGRMTMPEAALVSVYDDLPAIGNLLKSTQVRALAAGETQTVTIPWVVPATQGYQAVVFNVDFISNVNATTTQVFESNRQNNLTTAFLIIGTPPPGSYGIDMTAVAPVTVIRGKDLTITGDAHYLWGSRLPVMGALVTVAFDAENSHSNTISPSGRFSISARAPDVLGQYQVKIRVYDNNLYSERVLSIQVIDPPLPIALPSYCDIFPCIAWTPAPSVLIPDMSAEVLYFTGPGLFRADSGQSAAVLDSSMELIARVKNVGNLIATGGFSVRFHDELNVQIGDIVVYNGDVAARGSVNISASIQIVLDALGSKTVYATVSPVTGETNKHNNSARKTVEVRENRPDLRDYRGISFSSQPIAGDSVEVILDVLNRGPADLNQPFSVDYYIGDPDQGGVLVHQQALSGNLPKGDAIRSSMTLYTQIADDIEVFAVIDANNVIDEDSEYNNVVHATLHVCPATLDQSISLRASQSYPGMGENIQLSATVSNRCGLASLADSVSFYSGDPNNGGLLLGNVAVPKIAGGSYATVILPWTTPALPGETVLYTRLESNRLLANTSVYITTTPVPSPDLQVFSDDIFRVSPGVGEAVQLSTYVRNVSKTESASNYAVNFYVDSPNEHKKVGDTIVVEQALLPLSQTVVSANDTFIADEPFYAIQVEIIPNFVQGDSNVLDNQATTNFQVDGLVSIAEMPIVSVLSAQASPTGLVTGSFTVSHSENQIKKLRIHYSNTPSFANALFTDIGVYADLQATGTKTFSFDASQWIGQTVYYKVEVFNVSGVQTLPAPLSSIVLQNGNLPAIVKPTIKDGTGVNAYIFQVQLTESLPAGYGVFLNFDNQQGNWFNKTDKGGHFLMTDLGAGLYEYSYTLVKPGLRSFRAGIFNTQGDQVASNDTLIGGYSNGTTCTRTSCIEAALTGFRVKIGNPAIAGTGSDLFKNVDVASGNYHLSFSDLTVPGKGPAFNFSRAYNSLADPGTQWTFAYEMKAQFIDSFSRVIAIGPREDGRIQYYFKDMDNLWYALNAGNFDQLIENTDHSFVLYTQGNRLYRFAKPTVADSGRLLSIEDRLGNALIFKYSSNGELTGATDANGRTYTITRVVAADGVSRIQRVTDFANRYIEYSYDSSGMITSVRNVRGGLDQYSYAGNVGVHRYRLTSITDPRQNRQLTISYINNVIGSHPDYGKVETLTDGLNNVVTFSYGTDSASGMPYTGIAQPRVDNLNHNRAYILDADKTRVEEILDVTNFGDFRTKQTYKVQNDKAQNARKKFAELGLVTHIVEPNNFLAGVGTFINYSADGRGNPVKVTNAIGDKTLATYKNDTGHTNLTPVETILPPGVTAATSFSNFTSTGKAGLIIDAEGSQTVQTYSDKDFINNDWLVQSKNARNFTTTYDYDAVGNVTRITDALSKTTVIAYDKLGRVLTEVTPLGLTTAYTYDAAGNVLTKRERAADIDYLTQYSYDESNNLSYVINPKGHRTDYIYDELNRKTGESYLVGGVNYTRIFTYDALGRLKSTTNERDKTSQTFYTERSQVAKRLNPRLEATVTYTYDGSGNVLTSTDAEKRTITTSYDELNRKTKVVDDEGNVQKWIYNTAGQVATYQDARNIIADKSTQYFYDDVGNLTKVIDAEGGVTESTYDGNGNVLTVKDPNLHTTTYTYDALDRKLTTTLHDGKQWVFTYDDDNGVTTKTTPTREKTETTVDALNRVSQMVERAVNGLITRQINYTYDANGNVLTKTSAGNTISMSYDEINRVTSVTDQYGKTISYGYDKAGNRISLTYPGSKIVDYSFDGADRLYSLTDWLGKTTTYTLNKAGQPTLVVYGNGTKAEYIYDNAGRLTQLNNLKANGAVISSHQLTLDGAGNITDSLMDLPLLPALPPSSGAMSYDNNNRILSAGGDSYIPDDAGRIVQQDKSGIQTTYIFDINDHISSITRAGSILSSYVYDLNNNRISQTQNGTETRYVIDELASLPNVVAETDGQGVVSNYYIYGEGLVSQISAANDSHYYHFDQTGHTLALTDASGNVSDRYAYTPYGFTTSQGTTGNPFKFVGKYGVMDDGDGLHYMRARYYKEDIKRFVSLDALHGDVMNSQALNRYAYVVGNPIMGVDASGLLPSFGSLGYNVFSEIEKFGSHWLSASKNVLGDVPKDVLDVYIVEPSQNAITFCTDDIEKETNIGMKILGCASGSISSVLGAGLDMVNPVNVINVSIRTPIRVIANGDKVFEKELQDVASLVIGLAQIGKLAKNITHMSMRMAGAKKAISTILTKVDKRGLAANTSNYAYYASRYREYLLDAIALVEKGNKFNP